MVTYLAGNRAMGTNAERISITPQVGGWKELGRTTLGSSNTSIDVTSLPNKRYYMVLCSTDNTGIDDVQTRFNSDTGYNYSSRWSYNGTEGSAINGSFFYHYAFANDAGYPKFGIDYISNYTTKEKLTITHVIDSGGTGATNAPRRGETVGKWANTSSAISSLTRKLNTNTYNSGSEVVVLGYDPADTHTTNFWTELASVNASGSSTTLSSGTFTAKKYLWVQGFIKSSASSSTVDLQDFNGDTTGSNYSFRWSNNGSADTTRTSKTFIGYLSSADAIGSFFNMFIINTDRKSTRLNSSHRT